jgi:hypothetical protein
MRASETEAGVDAASVIVQQPATFSVNQADPARARRCLGADAPTLEALGPLMGKIMRTCSAHIWQNAVA